MPAFKIDIPVNLRFTQQGIEKVANDAIANLNKIAAAGLQGGAGTGGVAAQAAELRAYAAQTVATVRARARNQPVPLQEAAQLQVTGLREKLTAAVNKLVGELAQAISPAGISERIKSELAARSVASQEAVVRNSALLGTQVPGGTFANRDLTGRTNKFVSDAEATQSREAFAQYQQALIDAAQSLRHIAVINEEGRAEYVSTLGESIAAERQLNAEIRAEYKTRLAANDEYAAAVAASSLAERDIASRIKANVNERLLGSAPAAVETDTGTKAALQGQLDLGVAAQAAANSVDADALKLREATNAVDDAMLKAAASLAEIAAIGAEGSPERAAYVTAQAEAAFGLKLIAQEIDTEIAEREAANTNFKELVSRERAAREELANAVSKQAHVYEATGASTAAAANQASTFQRLQARFFNRYGNAPREADTFPQLGQFLGQKALTTAGFATSGLALYGGLQGIRTAVVEANKFQVALVALEEEFKAADDAGDFPKVKQALIDISNETGVAASEVAQIAQVFKGAFGDTQKALKETADSVRLAVVANLPTADITNFTLAVDTAFHTTAEKIGDLSLSIFEQTGVGVHEIVTGLGLIAPVADEAGLSIKETASILAIAEQKSGRSASSIAENFTRILPAIQKNGVAILDLIATVPGLDKEFQTLGQDLNRGQSGKFLTDLIPIFSKLGTTAQNTVIELLGGRREAGALIPVLRGGAQYADLMSKATDKNGKSAEYFAKTMSSLSKQLSVLSSEFKNFIGDLLRSGLANGLTDAIQLVGILFGGLQEIESVFKSINKLSHGLSGDVLLGAAALKGFSLARGAFGGAQRGINLGETTGLNAAAAGLQGSAVALTEAAGVLSGTGAAGAAGAAGRIGAFAAGGATTDIFGGSKGAIPVLPNVPILPIALGALVGFSLYKKASDNAKKLNADAAAAAQKVVDQYVKENKDALSAFSDAHGANLALSSSAQGDVAKRAREQASKAYNKEPVTFLGLGIGPSLPHNAVGRFFAGDLLHHQKDRFLDTAGHNAQTDLEKAFFDSQTKPFLDALKQAAQEGGTLDITTPRVKALSKAVDSAQAALDRGIDEGLNDKHLKSLEVKLGDAQKALGSAKALRDKGSKNWGTATGKAAGDQVAAILRYIGDGTNEKRNRELKDYIKAESNSTDAGVRETVARAREIYANAKAQGKAASNANDVQAGLDAQKQLFAAGAESAKQYLTALRRQINALLELQDASPLSADLKTKLAQYLKEENDTVASLADEAGKDAEFLAGLTQSGPTLAQTKVQLARAKLAAVRSTPGAARTSAAQDLLTAQQDAFAQSLTFLSPGEAYRAALKGYTPDSTAVDVLVKEQKDDLAGERAVQVKKRDFYTHQISRLDSLVETSRGRGDSAANAAKARDYRQKLAGVNAQIQALDDTPILDPAKALQKANVDSSNQRVLSADLIIAGDNTVKQAAARMKAAAATVASDLQFYGKVLPDDALAYSQTYNDLLFAKDFAAEQEKEQAIQLKIAATRNPEAKAALEKSLADTKAAYAASIANIPGHEQDAKNAANDAANTQITATNDAIDTANAIAKARLDLLAAMTQDPVEIAKIAIRQADEEAREAAASGDRAAQIEAAAHKIQAQHQLADAISAEQDALDVLLEALANFYGDVVKASQINTAEALRHLQAAISQHKGTTAIRQAFAQYIDALAAQRDAFLQQQEDTIDFNLQMNTISISQAIALYNALLATKDITVQERRQILERLQSLKQQLSQDLQFNLPTDLQLPTLYEARRFKQGGGAAGFADTNANSSQFNDNRQINININGARDTKAIVQDVVAAMNVPSRSGVRPRIY